MAAFLRASVSSHTVYLSNGDSNLTGRGVNVIEFGVKLGRRSNVSRRIMASSQGKTPYEIESAQEISDKKLKIDRTNQDIDQFEPLKQRFFDFKKHNYLENSIHYQNLSQAQSPKFMVIACADSRVCPSAVLGFQPGEAFTVRNIANLVPPFEHGASETNAALEFAVNTLEVENIFVIGHSKCGGIQALMSMKDNCNKKSFIKDWVSIGKSARLSTKAAAGNLSFEIQCQHCEKESINGSLLNLLTYPWIEKRVIEGKVSIHGGYYNFIECTFEKWTLVYREGLEGGSKYAIKNSTLWS